MSQIERIAITDRASWLDLRKKDVTASVAGALLGVHPYASAYGLWALKSGRLDEDVEETPPMRRGRLLEPIAVQLLREERPDWTIIGDHPVGFYYRDPVARIGATPDVLVKDERGRPGVVQIKTVEPGVFRREWRDEDGLATPPLWIVVQAIIEAHLTGAEWATVAAMVVSFGVELHVVPVPIHAGIIDRIKEEVGTFWTRVESGTAPDPDYGRDGKLIAKLYPQDDGTEIDLSTDNRMPILLSDREEIKARMKADKASCEQVEAEIKSKLGSATYGRLNDGRVVSWKLQNRSGYSVAPTSFRMLRVINGRAA
jgi:predicted phage-related endonuclease